MGMSSPEWSRYLHDQLGVPLEPEQINELVVAALLGQYRRRLPLLPGAVVAVRRLADRWPLGLASSANRPVIDAVLEQAGITDCFAVTVSGDEVAAGKPAPEALHIQALHIQAPHIQALRRSRGARLTHTDAAPPGLLAIGDPPLFAHDRRWDTYDLGGGVNSRFRSYRPDGYAPPAPFRSLPSRQTPC
jgi:Haloacid dehalogenase-like hydrolase